MAGGYDFVVMIKPRGEGEKAIDTTVLYGTCDQFEFDNPGKDITIHTVKLSGVRDWGTARGHELDKFQPDYKEITEC